MAFYPTFDVAYSRTIPSSDPRHINFAAPLTVTEQRNFQRLYPGTIVEHHHLFSDEAMKTLPRRFLDLHERIDPLLPSSLAELMLTNWANLLLESESFKDPMIRQAMLVRNMLLGNLEGEAFIEAAPFHVPFAGDGSLYTGFLLEEQKALAFAFPGQFKTEDYSGDFCTIPTPYKKFIIRNLQQELQYRQETYRIALQANEEALKLLYLVHQTKQ